MSESPPAPPAEERDGPATAPMATVRAQVRARLQGPLRCVRVDSGPVRLDLVVGAQGPSDADLATEVRDALKHAGDSGGIRAGARHFPPGFPGYVEALLQWCAGGAADPGLDFRGALLVMHTGPLLAVAHVHGDEPQLFAGKQPLNPLGLTLQGGDAGTIRALCLRPGHLRHLRMTWRIGAAQQATGSAQLEYHWESSEEAEVAPPAPEPQRDDRPDREDSPGSRSDLDRGASNATPQPPTIRRVPTPEPATAASVQPKPEPARAGVTTQGSASARAARTEPVLWPGRAALAASPAMPLETRPTPRVTEPPGSPDGAERVAHAAPEPGPSGIRARPRPLDLEPRERGLPRPWVAAFAAIVIGLFSMGLLIGRAPAPATGSDHAAALWTLAARLGLGGDRYDCRVTSIPEGARLAVDGLDTGRQSPATLRLKPGSHTITLRLDGAGGASFPISGRARDQSTLAADLRGRLVVRPPENGTRVTVWLDGTSMGAAPLTFDRLAPGPHELAYGAAGGVLVDGVVTVRVAQTSQLTARPPSEPAEGEVEVHARELDDSGPIPLRGVRVWVDQRLAGTTPLVLRLPRGPHSFRAAYRDQGAPVQVIDLPGGNRRYADFTFGDGLPAPRLVSIEGPGPGVRGTSAVVSGWLDGVAAHELLEMWVHVRARRGVWVRYAMAVHDRGAGALGQVEIPRSAEADIAYAPYYVSAMTRTGDEFFTEIQPPDGRRPGARLSRRAAGALAADR